MATKVKQNTINSERAKMNLNNVVLIFGFIAFTATAAAIYSLNASKQPINNQTSQTPIRSFDQATITKINNLNGSAASLPSTRYNPFVAS